MDPIIEEKVTLIKARLQEIMGADVLEKIVATRPLKVYWGTAPTGRIHIGYLVALLKIADFLKAGCQVKVLIADLHAVLDNMKSTSELVGYRSQYYELMIKSVLKNLGVSLDQLTFVKGTDYQLTSNYTMDMYKMSAISSVRNAKKAGAEVVKQSDNPMMSSLLYPILQALDEQYLDTDAFFGGIDQRRIATFASDMLPTLGYKKRIRLLNPMLIAINAKPKSIDDTDDNIADTKMSSSDINSKIDLLDSKNTIKKKINRAYCLEKDLTFNPLMDLVKLVIYPMLNNSGIDAFVINRQEKFGGPLSYASYALLEADFVTGVVHPLDLKSGIIECIDAFLEPIRQEFDSVEYKALLNKAYP